jgi:YegS/Rv2252/BmrU family lipid kinase
VKQKKYCQSHLKTAIIINPRAGRRLFLELYLPQILKHFKNNNIDYTIFYTRYPEHAVKIVQMKCEYHDFITVMGGDGTIDEVIKGMANHKKPLAIIPFGTANVLALDLGIPLNPIEAAKSIFTGYIRHIDLGFINGDPFVLMVSTGIDAYAVHTTDLTIKRYFNKLAYVFSAIWAAIKYRSRKIKIYLPELECYDEAYLVIISNSRFYGGKFNIDPDISITDGMFNVLLFKKGSVLEIFRFFIGVITKTHKKMDDVKCYKVRQIILTSRMKKRIYIQKDGDKLPFNTAKITLSHLYLPIIVPQK